MRELSVEELSGWREHFDIEAEEMERRKKEAEEKGKRPPPAPGPPLMVRRTLGGKPRRAVDGSPIAE